jgi:flagellar hook protein FlgE
VLFQDLFSQTLSGPRAPSGGFGGNNGAQVGLGVSLGTIDVNYSQGALLTTGVSSDLAIQGSGFFILQGDSASNYYTRDGSFTLNSLGELIDPATGMRVQGYLADPLTGVVDTNGPLEDLVIPVGGAAIVQATENVIMQGNLDSQSGSGDTVVRTIRVFDSLGTARDITVTFTKSVTTDEWDWAVTSTDADIDTITGAGTVTFDSSGQPTLGVTGPVSITFVAGIPSAPDPMSFDLDFSLITNLSEESDIVFTSQDGFPRGTLEAFNIGQGGIINGVFTNGLTRVIGQVALATFSNNGGLLREGNNLFRDSPASGQPQIGLAGIGGRGDVVGGVLENSNVDLGTEFSNLIVTQRGFQANARTITTADTLLQETVNLIR